MRSAAECSASVLRTSPPAPSDRRQEQLGGAGVVGLREVVRHMGGEAHRRLAGLGEPELQQVGGAARHLDRLQPGLVPLQQLGPARVDRDAGRTGVRHGHRDRVEPDAQPYAEVLDEGFDRRDEPLPLDVRLGSVQQQERVAERVGEPVQLERGGVVGLPVVLVEDHHGPAGAVVVQLVDVEARHELRVAGLEQVLTRELGGVARVDETGQGDHEHRLAGHRAVQGEVGLLVQVAGVEHEAWLLLRGLGSNNAAARSHHPAGQAGWGADSGAGP